MIVIDDAVDRAHGRMLCSSRMKSLELLKWALVVCCDCHHDAVDRAHGRML